MRNICKRASVIFITTFCLSAVVSSVWIHSASLQQNDKEKPGETKKVNATVRAEKKGNPYINFKDGRDLVLQNEGNRENSQPTVLASADFDSDGIADLVTADASGTLKFYRGKGAARSNEEEPFESTDNPLSLNLSPALAPKKNLSLNISPDFMFAGDFNADGNQDILAAGKNSKSFVLLSGNGRASFSQPQALRVDGNITAIATGEIGRKDGQTDVAVAVTNRNGAFLFVYEHPESAFKYKPEIFKLPAPTNEIVTGNLDEDFYADIAVACGNDLTIVHGRGQAYPWDMIPDSGIKRPAAFVATRRMPFAISAMTVGRFGAKRGESLAILGADGNIYRLEPNRQERPSNNKLTNAQFTNQTRNPFIPTDFEPRKLAILNEPQITPEEAERQGRVMIDPNDVKDGKFHEYLQKKQAEALENFKMTGQAERDKILADALSKKAEYKKRAKQGFLRSIAGKPSTLAYWTIETLTQNAQLASATVSNAPNKMQKVNVSNSNLDDILLIDSNNSQLSVVRSQLREDNNGQRTTNNGQIINLETVGNPTAVLSMRLNIDALSDLVVLREGASVPSVVMTAPMQTITVNSSDDTGDCQDDHPCSLRSAIMISNSSPGTDFIGFGFGGAATITPAEQLPVITDAVTIYSAPGGDGLPQIEITGANITTAADGLKIRASNVIVGGLAVNEFAGVPDNNGSIIGGNGITIESTFNSPNNGNNWITGNFLGTDRTGSLDKGNGAAGLNIFDADDNQITDNLISGNGNQQVRGVGIAVIAGNNNIFYGNIIGLNSLGTGKLGNSEGLFLTGANNQFGGDGAGQGNTVSGNNEIYDIANNQCNGRGIAVLSIIDLDTGEQLSLNNNLKGNRIGTNPAGTVGLGNCETGISTNPYVQTNIGSITTDGRNIVSDNGRGGIYCGVYSDLQQIPDEGGFCQIAGNNVGTDITGSIGISNDGRNVPSGFFTYTGVVAIENTITYSVVGSPGGTTPNGACTGFCNLISGSADVGFAFGTGLVTEGYGAVGIFNNFVGTNQSGNAAIPNDNGGIVSTSWFGTTFIGGDLPNLPLGNVVSGNKKGNIGVGSNLVFPGFAGTYSILGNRVGTDVSGNFSLQPSPDPNGNNGIFAYPQFGEEVYIGSAAFEGRNIISGNKGNENGYGNGIVANAYVANSNGGFIKIVNNLIGLSSSLQPLGNQAHGIQAGNGVQIGGTDQEANQIAYNGTNGRNFAGVAVEPDSFGVTIRNNSIHDNLGLGIDLNVSGEFGEADGVTINDCFDPDYGANGLQNYPELLAPVFNGNGTVSVSGVLRGHPRETYTLDFYASSSADESDYGEGHNYIGSISVETTSNGFVSYTFDSSAQVGTGQAITATATDRFGNTSEFSCAAGECSIPGGATTLAELEQSEFLISCISPIVVNVTGDAPDSDGDAPSESRDGYCDSDLMTSGEQCTLRAAIQEANARPAFNLINFDIPGGGVQTIIVQTALPEVTGAAFIVGKTQPGYTDKPLIKLDGLQTAGAIGLNISAVNTTVNGLAINGFSKGIHLNNSSDIRITDCFIGTNADGETAPPQRQQVGIELSNTFNSVISDNLISNNEIGINLIADSTGNQITGNKIGTNFALTSPIPNNKGVVISDSDDNTIGGEGNDLNEIAGNEYCGVHLKDGSETNQIKANRIGFTFINNVNFVNSQFGVVIDSNARRNILRNNAIGNHRTDENAAGVKIFQNAGPENALYGNRIGADFDGDAVPNKFGVTVEASFQTIGSNSDMNVIVNNLRSGIFVDAQSNFVSTVRISGNYIGTDGTNDAGNTVNGISAVGNAEGNFNLYDLKISDNVISGNDQNGIYIYRGQAVGIYGNKIGTNQIGDAQIPNGEDGIFYLGESGNIGGLAQGEPNQISSNGRHGILVETGSRENLVRGNLIGTTADGNNALGNSQNGVFLLGSENTVKENTISGNERGVRMERGVSDPEQLNNRIVANKIGTNPQGTAEIFNQTGVLLTNGAAHNTIKQNLISGNLQNGISLRRNANNNFIDGNRIGTTADGMSDFGSYQSFGIFIESAGNEVGLQSQNLISGNDVGIRISKSDDTSTGTASGNRVGGNFIGTDITGNAALPNLKSGIEITGGAANNIIGYDTVGGGINNVVSGNGNDDGSTGRGIYIYAASSIGGTITPEPPHDNKILGNYVGGNVGLTAAVPNKRTGILVVNSPNNIIGNNETEFSGNIVVGNLINGIAVTGANAVGNRVDYNYVGVTRDGVAIGNNPDGINIDGAPQTIIGNNNICGNMGSGIAVSNVGGGDNLQNNGAETPSVHIHGNRVGTIRIGIMGASVRMPNEIGIELTNVSGGLVGGGELKNVISGNNEMGILIEGLASELIRINNSIIGTDEGGANGLGNGVGIKISGAKQTTIGDTQTLLRNVIKLNQQNGVIIEGSSAEFNKIINNLIESNSSHGVLIRDGANINEVGGAGENTGNTISGNGGAGVRVDETAGQGNLIDPNTIFNNAGLGIDIGTLGLSPNDEGDADEGANRGQNYPEIVSKQIVNDELIVGFRIDSAPSNSNYGTQGLYVEFFKADSSGEGERFLGFTHYTVTDYNGSLVGTKTVNLGNINALGITANDRVTATATDADNNTSEFYPALAPTAADSSISGRVTDSNGQGIANITIALVNAATGETVSVTTNNSGEYRFENVAAGQTYIVAASSQQYTFSPPNYFINFLDELTGINFIAAPSG